MLARIFRATPRSLLAACALFFGAAFFAVRYPDVPGASAGSYISTFLIGLPAFLAVFRHLGPRRALAALFALAAFAYAIETVGVTTGFPYGDFAYGDALGPEFLGLVPYLLPVTYVPLVIGAVSATWGPPYLPRVVLSAGLLLLIDGVLDPGAVALGFWTYPAGGLYYGVPGSNFAGWLLSGAVAAALFLLFGGRKVPPPPGTLDAAILALSFWVGVSVLSGLPLPAALGTLLLGLFLARRARLRTPLKQH